MDATWQVYLREVRVVLVIDGSDTQTRLGFFCIDIFYSKLRFLLWHQKIYTLAHKFVMWLSSPMLQTFYCVMDKEKNTIELLP